MNLMQIILNKLFGYDYVVYDFQVLRLLSNYDKTRYFVFDSIRHRRHDINDNNLEEFIFLTCEPKYGWCN